MYVYDSFHDDPESGLRFLIGALWREIHSSENLLAKIVIVCDRNTDGTYYGGDY
jgi:hypothetical protein